MVNKFTDLRWGNRSPLTIIEFVIGLTAILGGLYLTTPYFVLELAVENYPSVAEALTSNIGLAALGVTAIISGLMTVIGIWRHKYRLRSTGLFINILLRIYTTLASILITGFFPINFSSYALLAIAIVCWLRVRGMIIRNIRE